MLTLAPNMMSPAVAFFHEHAGESYDHKTETPEQGRMRYAKELARAEEWLATVPHSIEWREDEHADRSGFDHEAPLFVCIVSVKVDGDWQPESMGGIDLGPTGNECDPYMRVVVAELASELMP